MYIYIRQALDVEEEEVEEYPTSQRMCLSCVCVYVTVSAKLWEGTNRDITEWLEREYIYRYTQCYMEKSFKVFMRFYVTQLLHTYAIYTKRKENRKRRHLNNAL